MLHNTTQTTVTQLVLVLITLLLAPCGQSEMVDLEQMVADINARKNNNVAPLPNFPHTPPFIYEGAGLRDPFIIDWVDPPPPPPPECSKTPPPPGCDQPPPGCRRPDTTRVRAGLELMPIDSLKMVGTLQDANIVWGLVMAIDGTVHRVKVGDYMGNNSGTVTNIEESKIELSEQIPDKEGCLTESPRTTTLALSSG